MSEFWALLLCMLSVIGLYAIFARVSVMLFPRSSLLLTVDGRGLTVEEILLLTARARFLLEREHRLYGRVSVLLSENEREKEMPLRKEGILVYIVAT